MPFDGSTISAATTGTFVSGIFTDTCFVGFADVDMVALTLVAGREYIVDLDNGGDVRLRIFDALGNEVLNNDDGDRATDSVVNPLSPYAEFVPNYSGIYYFAVSPFYMTDYNPASTAGRVIPENAIGNSTVIVAVQDNSSAFFGNSAQINVSNAEIVNDMTDRFRSENPLRVEMQGRIDAASDVDIARIDLTKGAVLVVDVNGVIGSSAFGTVLRVFNDAGVQFGFDDDSGTGDDPELVFVAHTTNDFYFGISADGNSTYNPITGAGNVAGPLGDYEVIFHLNPTLIGTGALQSISGTTGADYIVSLGGNDIILGGFGNDTLAGGDDNDDIRGDFGDDILYGEHGNDELDGGRGNDVLNGGRGDDTLDGDTNNDLLFGGVGNDTLLGGAGNGRDTLHGDDGNDSVLGGKGDDQVFGDAGADTVSGEDGNDAVFGGVGDDSLFGGFGSDTLDGGINNDTLQGDGGADLLSGGAGNDSLSGGTANDTLSGGAGADILTGDGGADVFVFVKTTEGVDTITDFFAVSLTEFIDLSAIFADTGSVVTAGNLAQFVQVTPAGAGADSFLGVDANGLTGGLDFTIIAQVNGVMAAQLFDFGNFLV